MKSRTTKKTLQINFGGKTLKELQELDAAGLMEGFRLTPIEGGFAFGMPLQPNENDGEGLPATDEGKSVYTEKEITFKFRLSFGDNGDLNLELAQKGSGRHFKFSFAGISGLGAQYAATDFEQHLYTYLFSVALPSFIVACYRSQSPERGEKEDAYQAIFFLMESWFGSMLKPKRFRVTDEGDQTKSVRVITSESIDSGRKPKTKADLEIERTKFLCDLFAAFQELEKKRIVKPKQKDLRPYIFTKYADSEKQISVTFTKYGLDFKPLWQTYLSHRKLHDFLSAVISPNKIPKNPK